MIVYGQELAQKDLWTKKIGPSHIAGKTTTLCGIPMLGNNYSWSVDVNNLSLCEDCIKKLDRRREKI